MTHRITLLATLLAATFSVTATAADAVPTLSTKGPPPAMMPQADIPGAAGMVFTAIEPCRLLDTRAPSLRSGRLDPNTQRDFLVYDADLGVEQGGAEGGCDLPDTVRAVAINLTAVGASGRGFVTAWDYGSPRPATANINLIPGEDVNNQLSVAINTASSQPDLMIYSWASTHLVADIVGYYSQPAARALECISLRSERVSAPANEGSNVTSPTCPAEYTRTGGSCINYGFALRLVTSEGYENRHFCASQNTASIAIDMQAEVNCCRVPGH